MLRHRAFHAHWPDRARRRPQLAALHEGVRRYGFTACPTSTCPCAGASRLGGKGRVFAHLGSGASVCAVRDGVNRCCSLHRARWSPMRHAAVRSIRVCRSTCCTSARCRRVRSENLLYHGSGLLGASGLSADVRDLLASEVAA
ncbi:MAG: hypothetical protein KIS89_06060 [Dokdonella sp.]|nr:hypothetical protein [Dokdonella sp.]